MSKVCIIGGGASGLVSSIYARLNGNDVTLLERNDRCGKKILVTGNGKCNYWNSEINTTHYHCPNSDILKDIISCSNQDKIMKFFKQLGIIPKIKNGYYYPMSNQAISIRNSLVSYAQLIGVKIRNNILVEYVNYLDNEFILNTSDGVFKCDKVIISTGSKALPKSGSDGMGYNFLKKFGHSITKPLPALVQLIGKGKYFKNWAGVRTDAKLTLYEDLKKVTEECGEVQLTDYGISGISTFQLSGQVARGLDLQKQEVVEINFMPWLNASLEEYMDSYDPQFTLGQILEGFLNYKLVNVILFFANLKLDQKWLDLTKEEKETLKKYLLTFKVEIIGTNGFDKCQVCSGGIPLNEINSHTMESIYHHGLYITGELLDVDGECGGYNLAFAWISGMIAGSSVSDD